MNRAMKAREEDAVYIDPALQAGDDTTRPGATPAERMKNSYMLSFLVAAAGAAATWPIHHFAFGNCLSVNVINFLFLSFAILLQGTPYNLLKALTNTVKGGAGIVIQFPFYAGIITLGLIFL